MCVVFTRHCTVCVCVGWGGGGAGHQTLHLWLSIYFKLQKLLMEKISIPWKTVKGTWNSSLLKKIKSFGKRNYEVAWEMSEDSGTKQPLHCSIKFSVKMKSVSLIFT